MALKKATYAEIAAMAGVSPATVSRIFTNSSTVRPETKKRVLEVMQQHGYNITKLQMGSQKVANSLLIFNLPSMGNPFYAEIANGAKAAALQHGYHLLINEEHINGGTINNIVALLKNLKVAGMITTNYVAPEMLEKLSAAVPLVQCCECNPDSNVPFVTIDDIAAASMVTDYIISLGRRRIALANGPTRYKYAKDRLEGYLSALKRGGISVDQDLILQLPELQYDMAFSAAIQMLESPNRPDAVFAASDVFAAGFIKAASRIGLKVPEDLVVVGFDNIDISSMTSPSITTVNQPKFQLGYSSCEILVERIANPTAAVRNVLLETELIVRESSTVDYSGRVRQPR